MNSAICSSWRQARRKLFEGWVKKEQLVCDDGTKHVCVVIVARNFALTFWALLALGLGQSAPCPPFDGPTRERRPHSNISEKLVHEKSNIIVKEIYKNNEDNL